MAELSNVGVVPRAVVHAMQSPCIADQKQAKCSFCGAATANQVVLQRLL